MSGVLIAAFEGTTASIYHAVTNGDGCALKILEKCQFRRAQPNLFANKLTIMVIKVGCARHILFFRGHNRLCLPWGGKLRRLCPSVLCEPANQANYARQTCAGWQVEPVVPAEHVWAGKLNRLCSLRKKKKACAINSNRPLSIFER